MKKSKYRFILLYALGSALAILLLNVVSKPALRSGGNFRRLFPPHVIGLPSLLDLKFNSYYIAGFGKNTIYLGNYIAPDHILASPLSNPGDTTHFKIQIEDREHFSPKYVEVEIDSPNVYMVDRLLTRILAGTLEKKSLENVSSLHVSSSTSRIMTNNNFAIKTYDSSRRQNTLIKYNTRTHKTSKPINLEKQLDGFFCTDGMMSFDHVNNTLYYVYFYRNQFIRLDSNLNISYKGNTIDTISHVRIKVSSQLPDGSIKLASLPEAVNKGISFSNGRLFIHSAIPAKNERAEEFEHNSVVDIYEAIDGSYLYSFYIPSISDMKVKSYRVRGNKLIALYERRLVVYDLHL